MANYEWVPCCDRFPEESGEYLVTYEYKEDRKVEEWYFSEIYGWVGVPEGWKIHAWMPMIPIYEHDGYSEFHVKTIEEMMEEASE